jgi:ArsR family transcriptional regulator
LAFQQYCSRLSLSLGVREGGFVQRLLQLLDPFCVRDFSAGRGVGDVEGVDRGSLVRADARKSDVNVVPAKTGDEVVEQAEPVRHFHKQVDGDLVPDGVCGVLIARKLSVSQPTASEHLKILSQAGLIRGKRIKQWTFYRRNEAGIKQFRKMMREKI